MSKWIDIMNNLSDGTETAIVGWTAGNDDGETIAVVIHNTKEVEHMDELAKTDKYAQQKIKEIIDSL